MKRRNGIVYAMLTGIIMAVQALCGQMYAQVYSCDFEDETENKQWTLNSGVFGEDCANRWYIGTAANNGGQNGLYISNDGGQTASYAGRSLVVISYRTLTLAAGTYELAFDWQAGASRTNAFYVCWIPDTVTGINSNINGFLPEWVEKYAVPFTDSLMLTSANWNTSADTIVSDGTPHKLAFVWNNKVEEPAIPGVCIDNIDILPVNDCEKPHDIIITSVGEKITISWQGNADSYDLRFKASSDNIWHEQYGLTSTQYESNDISEGMVDVYVRSHCGEEYSTWVSYSQFVFFKGTRCVDYLDLTRENCFYGTYDKPQSMRGVVNYGPYSIQSRHTIHYDPIERDPRTDNKLKTVPDGEIASVRLGNWEINGEGESVQFQYTVDASTSAILLLKYAVVLENPGHDKDEQPRFTLSILKNGQPLDNYGCGEADFSAGYTDEKWNTAQEGKVEWKDWTTVGINLAQYDGETLTIRLTTYDCTLGGHYGYAYFALGCSDGKMQGLSCGDTPTNAFKGPDGFKYVWYLPDTPLDTISTEQVLPVLPNDTMTYYCNVIQPTNDSCWYTISATAIPRWPVAEASYELGTRDCKNIVQFTNESYVKLVNPITNDTSVMDQPCETAHWDFGDGTTSDVISPMHEFPGEGGKYNVTLTAGLANGLCLSTYTFTVDLPEVKESTDTIEGFVCKGNPYEFHGVNRYSTGFYNDTTIDSINGCRVIEVLDLTVIDKTDTVIFDTVCSADLPYIFNGEECNESGTYTANLDNIHQCDSTVTLELYVNESLILDIAGSTQACADDGEVRIPFDVLSGTVTSYNLNCGQDSALNVRDGVPEEGAVVIRLPESIRPGLYRTTVDFANMECGNYTHAVDIELRYADSIIAQRWGDVLGVRNAKWNGGYEFTAYQWYENGQPLEGETSALLYRPDGLTVGAEYCVELTRADDGVKALTCAKMAQDFSSVEVTPTVTFSGGTVGVKSGAAGRARLWSAAGTLAGTYPLNGGETDITVNAAAGIYILEISLEDGTSVTEKIIVKQN